MSKRANASAVPVPEPDETGSNKSASNKSASDEPASDRQASDGLLVVGGTHVGRGERVRLELPVARLATGNWLSLPVVVVNGQFDGPRLCLSAAVHGDELNGVEIIRQVLGGLEPDELHGAVLAVPVVNVFGFIEGTRYLPDRRDLNRSFPGSVKGSLTAQLANLFMTEIVSRCQYGVDLHTGSNHRTNLPQIRADLSDEETLRLARAFGAPIALNAKLRDGSLRAAASKRGVHMLLYEAGETHRFNKHAVTSGVRGVRRVLAALEMTEEAEKTGEEKLEVLRADKSRWLRATRSGIFRAQVGLGDRVTNKQVVGTVSDTFGENERRVRSTLSGIVIGQATNPLVNRGDALLHVAESPVPL